MSLTVSPNGWSADKLNAFNDLMNAVEAYNNFDQALTKLGINNAVLNQDRTDLGNLIKNQLGPNLIAQG